MATLHERLIGENLPSNPAADETKIAIHAFLGALHEFTRGKLTGGEVVSMFSLSAAQQTNALTLKALIDAAPDKTRFMRVFKDWMYLGETGTDARYLSAANLLTRLQEEVTDQGGTLP